MTRHTQRRRIVAATVVTGALLLVGPAAYGVATAADAVDNPVATSSQEPDDDGGGDGQDQGDDQGQAGQDGAEQKDGQQEDSGEQAAADKDAGNEQGAKDGSQAEDKDKAGGLDVLATDCSKSDLAPHDGFQKAPRCVSTAFGEVGGQDKNPSLLITDAPKQVSPGQGFQIKVSTRNLVRDRFLAAAKGGYYKESSVLNGEGLQRGHFHTACRALPNAKEAPDAAPKPAFFLATEDGSGSATPDEVTIDVPGIEQAGQMQCSSWAGDGSHRIPMMQRADQTPAFDSVRITVG